jgi:hypothetical protein
MNYRRIFLAAAATFIGYCIWFVLDKDTATSTAVVWPLICAFIIILALPEKRLEGTMISRMIDAWKGNKNDSG